MAMGELTNQPRSVWRLRFPTEIEHLFLEDYWENTIRFTRLALILGIFLYGVFGVLDTWAVPNSMNLVWAIRYGIVCPVLGVVLLFSLFPRYRGVMQSAICIAGIVAGLGIVAMIAAAQSSELGYTFYYVGLIICLMFIYTFVRMRFWYAIVANIVVIAGYEFVAIGHQQSLTSLQTTLIFLTGNFFLIAANIVGAFTCYSLEYYSRRDYLQRCVIESERAKAEHLLLNILPQPIADRLKRHDQTIADSFESVSVLFADIANFTSLSTTLSPSALVEFLNGLFSHFDTLAEKYGIEKIKTIGDCYMAASGVPSARIDHAYAVACMALEMRDYVNSLPPMNGWRLGVRIGLNSGPVVAGVIGKKKYIYDLWGDTVNIASRMESHGSIGGIQITHSTYKLLEDDFICETRGRVTLKGKGGMEVWQLLSKRNDRRRDYDL